MSHFEKMFLDDVVELSRCSQKLGEYIEREMYNELDMEKPDDTDAVALEAYNEVYCNKFEDIVIAIVEEMNKLDDTTIDEICNLIHEGDGCPLHEKLNEVTKDN